MVELEIKPTFSSQARIVLVLLAGTLLLGYLCFRLFGGGTDLLARKATIVGYIPDATGVAPTSEVRLSGILIGQVTNVAFSGILEPMRAVRVDMRVTSRYLKSIPIDSLISVDSDTLVGYKFIEIAEGRSPAMLAEGGSLQSEPIQDALVRSDLVAALQAKLTDMDALVRDITLPDTKIGHFVNGDEEYRTLLGRIRGFDESIHSFLTPKSDLGQAFYSSKLYDDIHGKVTHLDRSLESIQRGEGAAGKLYVDPAQYDDLVRQLSDLRASFADANSGNGKMAAFLASDADWQRVKKQLRDADSAVRAINTGQGRAGQLLASPQLYESLTGSLQSLAALLKAIREHPDAWQHYKPF